MGSTCQHRLLPLLGQEWQSSEAPPCLPPDQPACLRIIQGSFEPAKALWNDSKRALVSVLPPCGRSKDFIEGGSTTCMRKGMHACASSNCFWQGPSCRAVDCAGEEDGDVEEADGAGWALPVAQGPLQGVIRPGIVHRLDKGTTGLLVVAKTDAALAGPGRAVQGAHGA